jgi:hypothetical protein
MTNISREQRLSEKWGCARKKGMHIMFSSTPNSTQEEPSENLLQDLALFKDVPHSVTSPSFSWISSSDG